MFTRLDIVPRQGPETPGKPAYLILIRWIDGKQIAYALEVENLTGAQIFRISGLALAVGAGVFIVHLVARSMITAGADPATLAQQALWVPVNLLGVLGAVIVLLGLPGTYGRMAGASGWPGLIGMVLITLAWLFFGLFLSLYSVLVAPWLADQAPALTAAPLPPGILITFVIAMLAELVGTVLLALPFLRGRVLPRWVGTMLPAAAILRVAGNLMAPSGPASNLVINLLSNLGPVLLMIALGALGFRLWMEHDPAKPTESGTG